MAVCYVEIDTIDDTIENKKPGFILLFVCHIQ
jgi:hypothetical protein